MTPMFRTSVTCLFVLCALGTAGCGHSAPQLTIDPALAQASFEQFLQVWKKGGNPRDLQTASPTIIVGEPDWEAGRKLTDFKILKDKQRNDGVNLHLTAQLALNSKTGQTSKHEITYIVGTHPIVTIHRQ